MPVLLGWTWGRNSRGTVYRDNTEIRFTDTLAYTHVIVQTQDTRLGGLGLRTFPCISRRIVRVTFRPPSETFDSIFLPKCGWG